MPRRQRPPTQPGGATSRAHRPFPTPLVATDLPVERHRPSRRKSACMTPLNQRTARRGRRVLPLFAGLVVVVLLGAAGIIAQVTASAGSGSTSADDTVVGATA